MTSRIKHKRKVLPSMHLSRVASYIGRSGYEELRVLIEKSQADWLRDIATQTRSSVAKVTRTIFRLAKRDYELPPSEIARIEAREREILEAEDRRQSELAEHAAERAAARAEARRRKQEAKEKAARESPSEPGVKRRGRPPRHNGHPNGTPEQKLSAAAESRLESALRSAPKDVLDSLLGTLTRSSSRTEV